MPRCCFLPLLLLSLTSLLFPISVVYSGFPRTFLPLERAFPLGHKVKLEELTARDRARHARILKGVVGGVVDFSVEGTSDPYAIGYG